MKARKIMIAVFAAVLAVQMTGCNKDIDTNKPVVIEVSVSEKDIEPKTELTWIELGNLTDSAEIRETVDMYFNNAKGDDGLKYGPFYIDATGTQCTNNTLKVVLGNRYVAEMFATGGNVDIEKLDPTNLGAIEVSEENTEGTMVSAINNSLDATYTDLSDSDRTPALFNAYFNLLPDSTPNYFNGGDTLSRAEAMALLTRATTPVTTLTATDDFNSAVSGTDYDQYINYAAQQNDNAYINTSDKSLTSDNFKGAMSRAEFIYLVMNNVYTPEAVQSFDTTSSALKDCTNAGDLSAELKISDSDRCNGYTLSHSLKNVDKGVTEDLYKSIAMAADKGIITPETRWNEGITKAEAIEIVVNAFNQYYEENGYLINNADKGSTAALETAAIELWEQQDVNDMSCTKEEFVADYIAAVGSGEYTHEQFEETIEGNYSIKAAEELAEQEKQIYIDSLWDCYGGEDNVTCNKDTFTKEYEAYAEEKGDSYVESEFGAFIQDKYPVEVEVETPTEKPSNTPGGSDSGNTGSTGNTGNGGSSYTPPAQTQPVYTPPAQTTPVTPVTPPSDNGNSSGGGLENSGGGSSGDDWESDLSGFGQGIIGGDGWIEGAD